MKGSEVNPHHPPQNAVNDVKINKLRDGPELTGSKSGQIFSLESSLFQALEEISKEKKMFRLPKTYIDYKPPKLHRGKSSWYVSYYVKNPETGKFKLFRIKVNHFRNTNERLCAAKEIMADLHEKLSLGWNPLIEAASPRGAVPAFKVFQSFIRVKEKELEPQAMKSYRSYIKIFQDWLTMEGFTERTLLCTISETVAKQYMAYLEEKKGLCPRSYNNHLSFLGTFFDWMIDKGYSQRNPFRGIKRKPKRLMKKKRQLISATEMNRLIRFLQNNNPEYLAACMLCYCCFMRPKEIALLKCRDLDLNGQIVHVRPEIAKNDNESYRTIPNTMLPALRVLDLSDPDKYLFGGHKGHASDFTPSDEPSSKKRISDYWERTIRPELGFPMELQFYSLKDTGITNMLGSGVAINLVQQQADHSSVAMTAVYVGHKASATEILKKTEILPV